MRVFIFIILLFTQFLSFAQVDSTSTFPSNKTNRGRMLIVPAALCLTGVAIQQTSFDHFLKEKVQSSQLRTTTKIDDYFRYAPMAEIYVADIYYSKSLNEVFHQTKNLFLAKLLSSFVTSRLKDATEITRPNGDEHSFPSGHSTLAFTGAMALFLEYKDTCKIVAYSGFVFSTATGLLRITNNKHWLSDVLVGAGIGMLSAQLVWYINPFGKWKPFKDKKISMFPVIDGSSRTFGFCVTF